MTDYLVKVPPRISLESELQDFLINMDNHGGSDLFLLGSNPVWMSINGKKARVTDRALSDQEILFFAQTIHDVSAQSSLFSGNRIDVPYEFKTKQTDSAGRSVTKRHRYRVNMVSCLRNGRNSLTITIRGIPTTPPLAKDLGVEQEIIDTVRQTDQGLIIIVGATGSGKSTLMASVLREQLEDEESHLNLVTVESPVEFVYDDVVKPSSIVTQLQVGKNVRSFDEGVINCMRMAPNTILVGELRDYETVSAGIEASSTGHAVIGTAHANSIAETFQRLVSVYPKDLQHQARFDIVQSCKMIVAQRLLPKKDGGRVAVKERLILNQEMKDRLVASANLASEAFAVVEEFGVPMIRDVEDKFNQGLIDEKVLERQRINYNLLKKQGEMSAV